MSQTKRKRALIVVRLSPLTDATTSPERQLKKCRELCTQRGYEIVGVAEDLDVIAGTTTPFDRPQLGPWLTNRFNDFDVLVFFRVDRIVRRLFDLADMIKWSREHEVTLVSATESHFDLSSDFGDILALLVAKVAEMELEAISERIRSASQHNMKEGKYRGGHPPWGYVPTAEDGARRGDRRSRRRADRRLVQAPDQVKVIQEVVGRVLEGEPLRAIAHDLTGRGVPTPADCFAIHQGREPKGYKWTGGRLKKILVSEALLGYAMSGEKPLRNEDGSPVIRAEAILTREVFDRVGVELTERENRREPTKRSTALLLRIISCGVCGRPAYKMQPGPGRALRYRCASAQDREKCGNISIPLAEIDDAVESMILTLLKGSYRMERVWDSGTDHGSELAEIDDALADLTDQLGTGAFTRGTPQRERLDSRIAALAARQAALSEVTVKPAGWEWTPTDELFSDWWAGQDVTARNVWLRSMNVRVEFDREQTRFDFGDLETLTEQTAGGSNAAAYKEMFAEMTKRGVAGMEVWPDRIELVERGEDPVRESIRR